MNRPSLAVLALAALAVAGPPCRGASAASAPAHAAKKPAARTPAAAEPDAPPDDDLNPAQLSLSAMVLTGVAACELNQKVEVQRLPGHDGNFRITFDRKSYIVQPRETTTGAIVLVDKAGNVEWLQIPKKSMLMNVKLHQRLVDNCQENEQRIASQAVTEAAANAPMLAPSVAGPAAAASTPAAAASAAPGSIITTTVTTTTTVQLTPAAPTMRGAQPPDAAASGMFR